MSGAVWIAAAQSQKRFCVKGPRAADALRQVELAVPERANSWAPLRPGPAGPSADVIARLGNTEFFIEERGSAVGCAALEALLGAGFPGAYPVSREDFGFDVGGPQVHAALSEVCNVNFQALDLDARPIVMTLMIGVGVLVLPQSMSCRIWCDPSHGQHLYTELEEIVRRVEEQHGRSQ